MGGRHSIDPPRQEGTWEAYDHRVDLMNRDEAIAALKREARLRSEAVMAGGRAAPGTRAVVGPGEKVLTPNPCPDCGLYHDGQHRHRCPADLNRRVGKLERRLDALDGTAVRRGE